MQHPDCAPDERAGRRRHFTRRTLLAGVTAGLSGCVSGTLDDPSFPEADVIVAPDDELVFDPAGLSVSVGETVRWGFTNAGHNVSCRPEDADEVASPTVPSRSPVTVPGTTRTCRSCRGAGRTNTLSR